jgi:glycogen(starch) synthase
MYIVLVSFEFPPFTAIGGIGSYIYHLSVFLSSHGHKVTVFSANPQAKELTVIEYNYCVNYLVPSCNIYDFRNDVLSVFDSYIKTNIVDLIESPEVGACALSIKQKYPYIPLVVKMHTPGVLIVKISNTYTPLIKKLRFVFGALIKGKFDAGFWATYDKNRDLDPEYHICILANKLLSPSFALKKWAIDFWGINREKIEVVKNPFSLNHELFTLPLNNRPNIISFVGKLSVLKGMKSFTKAIPIILKKNKGYKILLVGRDEFEFGNSMKEYMLNQLGEFRSEVVFMGALDSKNLINIYASSKVCVFPSLWENYPNVVLESMAAGSAVAASKRGGIPEIIQHNVNGLLFNPLKPREIARAINELLSDEVRRLSFATVARNELIKSVNNKQYEKELLKVYTQF